MTTVVFFTTFVIKSIVNPEKKLATQDTAIYSVDVLPAYHGSSDVNAQKCYGK
jgi:hypothetical protein